MEASREFNLTSHNHSINVVAMFQQFFEAKTLVDVTLSCSNGTSFTAHRIMLAASSEYFEKLFMGLPQQKHTVIVFIDAEEVIVRDFLMMVYEGSVKIQEAHLKDFLKFAEIVQLKGLSKSDRAVVEENVAAAISDAANRRDVSGLSSPRLPGMLQTHDEHSDSNTMSLSPPPLPPPPPPWFSARAEPPIGWRY